MAVNTSKTKFIIFRTRGKRTNPVDCLVFYNNDEIGLPEDPNLIFPVTRVHSEGEETSFKLLGILFDEYLSFEHHVIHLCTKISKSLFCINWIKNFVNPASLKMLYYSMVHSHITYCITVYGCTIRIISNAGYRDHTNPPIQIKCILPLDDLIKYSILKFMQMENCPSRFTKLGLQTGYETMILNCGMRTICIFQPITWRP